MPNQYFPYLSQQWADDAACRNAEKPDIFSDRLVDPPKKRGRKEAWQKQHAEAKAICRTCTVLGDCLRYALATGQGDGVWGGLTPQERRRLDQAEAA